MKQIVSVCGILCNECDYFKENCLGCYMVKGSTFWAKEALPDKLCPIYKCAILDKKYHNCGACSKLPCKTFIQLKDPTISDEQHKKSIDERVSRLR